MGGTVGEAAPTTRAATADDVDELLRLRRLMFDSMGVVASDDTWERACRDHLVATLGSDELHAAVVDHPEGPGLVAGGMVEVHQRIPGAMNVQGRTAYISSMSTDAAFRRRGLARAVLVHLLGWIGAQGIEVVDLHATVPGEGLYRELGFERRAQPELRRYLGR